MDPVFRDAWALINRSQRSETVRAGIEKFREEVAATKQIFEEMEWDAVQKGYDPHTDTFTASPNLLDFDQEGCLSEFGKIRLAALWRQVHLKKMVFRIWGEDPLQKTVLQIFQKKTDKQPEKLEPASLSRFFNQMLEGKVKSVEEKESELPAKQLRKEQKLQELMQTHTALTQTLVSMDEAIQKAIQDIHRQIGEIDPVKFAQQLEAFPLSSELLPVKMSMLDWFGTFQSKIPLLANPFKMDPNLREKAVLPFLAAFSNCSDFDRYRELRFFLKLWGDLILAVQPHEEPIRICNTQIRETRNAIRRVKKKPIVEERLSSPLAKRSFGRALQKASRYCVFLSPSPTGSPVSPMGHPATVNG